MSKVNVEVHDFYYLSGCYWVRNVFLLGHRYDYEVLTAFTTRSHSKIFVVKRECVIGVLLSETSGVFSNAISHRFNKLFPVNVQ